MTPIEVPPIDPGREQALLAAFDSHWARRRPAHWARPRRVHSRRPRLTALTAAMLALSIGALNWMVVTNRPGVDLAPAEAAFDMTGFVPLPGAEAWPPIESGSLVRMNLPVSALSVLGLQAESSTGVVQADVVVGQDGVARAIRVVQ